MKYFLSKWAVLGYAILNLLCALTNQTRGYPDWLTGLNWFCCGFCLSGFISLSLLCDENMGHEEARQ